jgi:hypothetical protein
MKLLGRPGLAARALTSMEKGVLMRKRAIVFLAVLALSSTSVFAAEPKIETDDQRTIMRWGWPYRATWKATT